MVQSDLVHSQPSQAAKEHVADLIRRQKTVGLSDKETVELNNCLEIEHLMRLAKARARAKLKGN